jgi:ribosomal protein S18 acetylase RimI-like enzyme
MDIRAPETKEDFKEYYQIRWETLRGPWGRPKGSERVEGDKTATHMMAVDGDRIVGVARGHMNTDTEGQIRLMGVIEDYRSKGVGRIIMDEMEASLKNQGAEYIVIHARDYALDFYKKCGYEVTQKSYFLWNEIQHWKMKKDLD